MEKEKEGDSRIPSPSRQLLSRSILLCVFLFSCIEFRSMCHAVDTFTFSVSISVARRMRRKAKRPPLSLESGQSGLQN